MQAGFAQAGILLVGLAAILLTFRDYGASWDESTNLRYGDLILRYFASGFQDRSVDEFLDLRFYGPLFDLLSALWVRLAPDARVEAHHLLLALTGLGTLPALFRLGRLLDGPIAGLAAAAALGVMPVFYGHSFINGKDIPFACAFTWAMVAMIRLGEQRDRASWMWGRVLVCGAAIGAACAVRPGGFLLLAPMLLAFAALEAAAGGEPGSSHSRNTEAVAPGESRVIRARAGLSESRSVLPSWGILIAKSAVILAAAWIIMIALWPWAHPSPIIRPIQAMRVAAGFPTAYPVLFAGEWFQSNALPRRYLLEYVAITTPPAVLLLAIAGVMAVLRRIAIHPRSERSRAASMVLLWLAGPLALWTLLRPNIVDGLRHFLFVMPALALMAGIGAAVAVTGVGRLIRRFQARGAGVRQDHGLRSAVDGDLAGRSGSKGSLARAAVALLLLVFVLAGPVAALVSLHPYQMTYFNGFVGGLAGADGRYETEYWLTSYKEGMEWIQQVGAPAEAGTAGEGGTARGGGPRVLVAANALSRMCALYYAAPRTSVQTIFEMTESQEMPPDADFYLSTTRYGLDRNFPASRIVHRIGRGGATFSVIRRREPSSAP